MAYGIIAEAKSAPDWQALHGAIQGLYKRVEVFPITPAGLGLSVPQIKIDDAAWEEIEQILDVTGKKFGMEAYDLASGLKIEAANIDAVRKGFLGEDAE